MDGGSRDPNAGRDKALAGREASMDGKRRPATVTTAGVRFSPALTILAYALSRESVTVVRATPRGPADEDGDGGPGGPGRAVLPPLRAFPLPLHDGIVGVVAVALAATSRHVAAGGGPTLPGLRAVPLLGLGLGRVLVAAAGPAGRAAGGGNLDRRGHAQRSCW